MTRFFVIALVACSAGVPKKPLATTLCAREIIAPGVEQDCRGMLWPTVPPRLVFTEVTNSWVPELRCDDGVPGYSKDGAIVLCLHGPIVHCPVQR